MPTLDRPLRRLGFLTIGLFDPADPGPGHEATLELIELGEQLGFDSAWLRHRHLQHGISSPLTVLAAASQRTQRIELGTAVTPLGWENPLRLAEDLATVDLLAGGRLNPGVSVGPPMRWDDVKDDLYPTTAEHEQLGDERLERLLRFVEGGPAGRVAGTQGFEVYSDRVEPHSPGLRDRLWYGAASLGSAVRAARLRMNLLTSSIINATGAPDPTDFAAIQAHQIREFRAHHPAGEAARVSQGLVVIPTDGATPAQRARYEEFVARRTPRTAAPGPGGMLAARDLIGTADEIAEQLAAHEAFREVDEVAFALPFTFGRDDYVQILTDVAQRLGPALGWSPAPAR